MTTLERNLALALLLGFHNASAAPFQNLGFEDTDLSSLELFSPGSSIPGAGVGPTSDLLPGWNLFHGVQEITALGFNYPDYLQPTWQTLIDRNYYSYQGTPTEGEYSLFLTRGLGTTDPAYRLTQSGDIPSDAQFLSYTYTGRPFVVTVNGVDVTRANFPTLNPRTVLADISIFAGQTVELTFSTTPAVPVAGGDGPSQLDAIAFVVPEPSTVALWVVSVSALVGRWVWSRKRPPS